MEVVKCKYCGKILKSIQSINMKCGPECLKKHYKAKTLLDWYDETIAKENQKMTKDEVIKIMNDRGFFEMSNISVTSDTMTLLMFAPVRSMTGADEIVAYPSVTVKLVNEKAEFRATWNTKLGALTLATGWCSPLTDDKHFQKHYSLLQEAATQLLKWECER